ncbi:outer membrane protein assembly factor BamD [Myxococcaceae bacterium GXIMD 01537]
MRSVLAACLTAVLFLSTGCASLSGAPGQPDYAAQADTNMRLGQEAIENKDWLRAEQYFEYVRQKFPYLEASKEAELRLADVDFERGLYAEAREKYETFIKLHPTHSQVDYAAYRAALTHVKEYPSEFFALPPSQEKDQTEIKNALLAMGSFLKQYPNSQYAKDAQTQVQDARTRLAEHEMYVAAFYRKRERWKGVASRLEGMLQQYPGTKYEEEALFMLYDAYGKLNEPAKAQATLRKVIERLPGTPAAEKAQRLLGT